MRSNILLKAVKLSGALTALVFSVFLFDSCNNDYLSAGKGLVDGNRAVTETLEFPIVAWNVKDFALDTLSGKFSSNAIYDPNNPNNNISQMFFHLAGNVYRNQIGWTRAGFALQPIISDRPFYGGEVLDSVILTLNYTSITEVGYDYGFGAYNVSQLALSEANGKKGIFAYGDTSQAFTIQIYQLGEEFPETSSQIEDTDFQRDNFIPLNKKWALGELIHEEEIKINLDTIRSTVTVVDTSYVYDDDGTIIERNPVYQDSILPSLKLKLNPEFFRKQMFEYYRGTVMTQKDFNSHIKGLYIKVKDGQESPMAMFLAQDEEAGLTFYYHSTATESDNFTTLFYSSYLDASNSANSVVTQFTPQLEAMFSNPDTINGNSTLILQPFGGSEIVLKLIDDSKLDALRDYLINDAYIEFQVPGMTIRDVSFGFPIALWAYKAPYRNQFNNYQSSAGYARDRVDYYLADEGVYAFDGSSKAWSFVPGNDYGLNGIINQNPSTDFKSPITYRLRVTQHLTELLYNQNAKNVNIAVRLPMGVSERAPYAGILNGRNVKLVVKATKKVIKE